MQFNEYQELTSTTAQYPKNKAIEYLALGLGDEAGEVQGKIKKWMRGDTPHLDTKEMAKELGDVLWYLAQLAVVLNLKLEDIAIANIDKLASRQERNVIKGNGDNR